MTAELGVTDLGLAAYLTTQGYPLLRLEGRPGRHTFIFPQASADAAKSYFADAPVAARTLAEAMRDLKARIAAARLLS